MKILTIPSWYRAGPGTNDGNFFRQLSAQFISHGVDCEILYASIDLRDGRLKWRHPMHRLFETKEDGVPTFRYNCFFLPKRSPWLVKIWVAVYLRAFDAYLRLRPAPDLIHAHSYLAGYLARAIWLRYRIPYLLTEHSTAFAERKIPGWMTTFIRGACDSAAVVTAVSNSLVESLREYSSRPIVRIPNGVDTTVFFPATEKPPNNRIRFLTIGAPSDRKGYYLLLESMAKLYGTGRKNMTLRIGDRLADRKWLQKTAETLGINENVTFLGSLDTLEVAREMRDCHIYVSASYFETFGLTILEAMACGKPIVTTATDGPRDFFDDRAGIMIPIGDKKALTQALTRLYDTHEQYDPLVISSLVREKYSFERVAGTYIRHFRSIFS